MKLTCGQMRRRRNRNRQNRRLKTQDCSKIDNIKAGVYSFPAFCLSVGIITLTYCMKFLNKRSLLRCGAALALMLMPVLAVNAQTISDVSIGLPGPTQASQIQITDMRTTYRFDQINQLGKENSKVPVQLTVKLHNPSSRQELTLGIPVDSAGGQQAALTSLFINGQEQHPAAAREIQLAGVDESLRALTVTLNMSENSDAIIDMRFNQPSDEKSFGFFMHTAHGWSGPIVNGAIEAILPYDTTNWNVSLRKIESDEIVPLSYSGRSASWSFTDLDPVTANDVYWQITDPDAMSYFERGNTRWKDTRGDAESYDMLYSALMDMKPCEGVKIPLASWWNNIYETIANGKINSAPEGQERLQKALELWSYNWSIPSNEADDCVAFVQRPELYKNNLQQLLAISSDQRSSATNDALKKHFKFLHTLSEKLGDNSLAAHAKEFGKDTDPVNVVGISETDKALFAKWDARFARAQTAAEATGTSGASAFAPSAMVSSTVNKIVNFFPALSFRTQVILFALLVLAVLILAGYIILGWKEDNNEQSLNKPETQLGGLGGFKSSPNLMQAKEETPKTGGVSSMFQNVPPQKPSPNGMSNLLPQTKPLTVNTPPVAIKTTQLDESYTDKKPAEPLNDAPWMKHEKQDQLIQTTTTPLPAQTTSNPPWKKNDKKDNLPPKPTIKI